jgi:menaquinone-specific isochorismate synthase
VTSALLFRSGLRAVTREIDAPDDILEVLGPDGFAWLHDDLELVTAGAIAQVDVDDAPAALAEIDAGDGLPGMGPLAVGALPFDPAAPARLTIPATVVGRRAGGPAWITTIGSGLDAAHAASVQPSRFTVAAIEDRAWWRRAVFHALDEIAARELDKVVLSRAVTVEADEPFDRRAVLARLRAQQPGCFVYGTNGFVGATPELLVRRIGRSIVSRPLAGTAVGDPHELVGSAKDRSEHRYVVDAVARELDAMCETLDVPDSPHVVTFADVAHLATSIQGRLAPPPPPASLIAQRLHPTPAVAGTPTAAALAEIAHVERTDRGCYAGPVGWVDARGDGEWAVALRGAAIDGSRAVLRTGAGIVAGSDPDREWAETELKLEPMLRALVRP